MDELDLGNTIKGFIPGQKVLNRYKLERILGRGGMGVVWLARDEELERDVALKFLPEIVALDPEAVADLKRETRRNLDLTHPHIVRIHDFESDKRTAAIAMEYVDGSSLAALKLGRPGRVFTVGELRPWIEHLLEALHYAHTKAKVVHRDLKPANLMITSAGDLKITDFGIAHSITDSVSRVSKQAGSSGTPVYMSPQQMMGEKAAVTDEIYAIGATLYELLTGKPPFYSGNVFMQVQNKEAPPIAERRAELGVSAEPVPPEWEKAILACLAKNAAERPQNVRKLEERLGIGKYANMRPAPVAAHGTDRIRSPVAVPPPRVLPAPPRFESKPKRSFSTELIYAAIAVMLLCLLILGWNMLVDAPERARAAERNRRDEAAAHVERVKAQSAEKPRAGPSVEMRAQDKKDIAPVAAKALPQFGQRWVIPDLGLEMIPIAPGTFAMGSASSEERSEQPVTQVTLTNAFWLGKTEVTQAQWQAVMGDNPSHFIGDDLPIEMVSWDNAMEFCRKLTERERSAGRLLEGYAYTLPTEAQWEYACRAGSMTDYTGGMDTMGWYALNSGNRIRPVAQKQANQWDLQDMHGNVWEWCLDWHGAYPGGSVKDPMGASSGTNRVKRGGSYNDSVDRCSSVTRSLDNPHFRGLGRGFRLALAPIPMASEAKPAVASKPQPGQPWENSLGQKFVPVPGTDVLFCIWETRVHDFETFVRATGHDATQSMYSVRSDGWGQRGDTWKSPGFAQGSMHPVVGVNWSDAYAFCQWLTEKERREGRLAPDQGYRLPTYHEWNSAAGPEKYPWGNQWPPPQGAGNYAGSEAQDGTMPARWGTIEGYRDNFPRTAPVGSFSANHYGIHDLGGNVQEFISNWHDSLRGASFLSHDHDSIVSSRLYLSDRPRNESTGFRVVLVFGSVR